MKYSIASRLTINKAFYHILYWILIVFILIPIFGTAWQNNLDALYFIFLLLPVIIITSYFFNYFLVPKYLLQKRYFPFILYSIYSVIVSLFLEMAVLVFTFVYRLQFNFSEMSPHASDTLLLAVVMYLVVFFTSFLVTARQLQASRKEVENLKINKEKLEKPFLHIVSQRRSVRIPYDEILFIESYTDFIKVISESQGEFISKEKISKIEKALPDKFLRIHRSFIVNKEKIFGFDYQEIVVNGITLNIGRTYKKKVLKILRER